MSHSRDENNKPTFVSIPQRFEVEPRDQEGVIAYDLDNLYPQRIELMIKSSVTATSCRDLYWKFTKGQGFADTNLGDMVINQMGQTADELLSVASKDYATFGGLAIHFDVNGLLEVVNPKVVPFDFTRLGDIKDNLGKIAINRDWVKAGGRKADKDSIVYVDRFTTNKDQLLSMIQGTDEGTLENFNGVVLWWSNEGSAYPTPTADPASKDILIDMELAEYKWSNVATSFLASYIFLWKQKLEGEGEKQDVIDSLQEFQGGQNAGKILFFDGVSEENTPELLPVNLQNNDRLFEFHETSAQNQIRKAYQAPRELIGEEGATGFDTNRIDQARSYYNSITVEDRDQMTKIFGRFLPELVASTDYTILPLFDTQEAEGGGDVEKTALNGAQITSMQGIVLSVAAGEIPKESAKALISAGFPSLSSEEVGKIIDPIQIKENGTNTPV